MKIICIHLYIKHKFNKKHQTFVLLKKITFMDKYQICQEIIFYKFVINFNLPKTLSF